ncbi:MAG: type II secretion system protein [Verrucomicrobia bacterium]|nr:type II secretion system protein [Verrucomicrobiota bacterium]
MNPPAPDAAEFRGKSGQLRGSPPSAAFTLIELLVVIGIIVALVVASALALAGRGSDGVALSNAQTIVTGLVGATRAQAALHQTNARLLIYAQQPPAPTADAAKYLRTLQIVRQETAPSGTVVWVAAGDPVTLPAPICVVPPAPVPTNHLRTGVVWNNNAAMGPVSTLAVSAAFSYNGQSPAGPRPAAPQYFGANRTGRVLYLEFAPDGTVVSNPTTNPTKVALTTAVLGGNAIPLFNNASAVRGLFVRKSGAISLVDESTGF